MKVGIDATWAGVTGSGTATYTRGLVQALAAHRSCHLVLYFRPGDQVDNPLFTLQGDHIEKRIIGGWRQTGRSLVSLARACAQDRLDVFHSPGYFLPLWSGPKVVTFHDVNMFRQWDKWWETGRRKSWLSLCGQTLLASRLAHRIVADSHTVAQDIHRVLRISPQHISVIYPGVDDIFFVPTDPEKVKETRRRYELQEYVLFVGVLAPLKNIDNIVRSFAQLGRQDLQLAIVGRPYGGYFDDVVRPLIHQLGVQQRVRVLGTVPDQALPSLYAGASASLFPSFSEGFGLPPLEAMACGTPVVASNRPSLPEILQDAALKVDPMDVAGMARALRSLLENEAVRAEMVKRGLQQASLYRWELTATRMLELYSTVVNDNH
jgi:glycosyltransferase involved in cell wall biosynthesis